MCEMTLAGKVAAGRFIFAQLKNSSSGCSAQFFYCQTARPFSKFPAASCGPLKVNVKQPEVLPDETLPRYGTLPALDARTEAEYFKDFRLYIDDGWKDDADIDEKFRGVADEDRPLVMMFGWGGANIKNLNKYADIHRNIGCQTLNYILPSRFLFDIPSQIPYLATAVLEQLKRADLEKRPVFFHIISDTGVLCYQGLDIALRSQGMDLDIRGMILDSCPGERPRVTWQKVVSLSLVHWICCLRDGQKFGEALQNQAKFMRRRIFTGILNCLIGKEPYIDMMENTFCGDVIRLPRSDQKWPELFLYSKTDLYVSHKFTEDSVIDPHVSSGRDVTSKRWDKSPHVCHLQHHKKEYIQTVQEFMYKKHYATLDK